MALAVASQALQSTGVFCVLGIALGTCLVLVYSPYFGKQWLPYLQQKSCKHRCFCPGQSNHCGGRQEYSCQSALSHNPCAGDYLEW